MQLCVLVREAWVQRVLVNAESAEQAKDKVFKGEGDYLEGANHLEYSHTLDSSTWSVENSAGVLILD